MAELIFKKLDMQTKLPDGITTTYFINPSHQSTYISIPVIARQRLHKSFTVASGGRSVGIVRSRTKATELVNKYKYDNRRGVRNVDFYAVRMQESRRLVLLRTSYSNVFQNATY
jgi:hypothetical protein